MIVNEVPDHRSRSKISSYINKLGLVREFAAEIRYYRQALYLLELSLEKGELFTHA